MLLILEIFVGVMAAGIVLWWSVSASLETMLRKQSDDLAEKIESAMNNAIESHDLNSSDETEEETEYKSRELLRASLTPEQNAVADFLTEFTSDPSKLRKLQEPHRP